MSTQEQPRVGGDLDEVATAFENGFPDLSYDLALETGAVVMVSDEIRRELETLHADVAANDDVDAAVVAALQQRNVPDWQREALVEADRVEQGYGTRYVTVPRDHTRDAYSDMADFIRTVDDGHRRERLMAATDGRGAFSRFKSMLSTSDAERARWCAFRDARLQGRIVAWLGEDRIEPVPRHPDSLRTVARGRPIGAELSNADEGQR